jgi:hypothetical protein
MTAPLVVFISKPAGASFGEALGRLRIWLDENKIEPAAFKLAPLERRIGFEISFRNESEAALFADEFGWHTPA